MENPHAHPSFVESGDILADCTWGAIVLLIFMLLLVSPILFLARVVEFFKNR